MTLMDSSGSTAESGTAETRSPTSKILALGRVVLMALVLLAASYTLYSNWTEVRDTVFNIGWQIWVPAFVVLPLGIGCSTLSWQVLVDELGDPPVGVRTGSQIFLVGQLGKYLPGSVWAYVLQMELGRRVGVSRTRVFTATIVSLVVIVVAALIAGSVAIPAIVEANPDLRALVALFGLLPVGLVALHPTLLSKTVNFGFKLLRRPAENIEIRKRAVLLSLAYATGAYFFFGVHLWLLAQGAGSVGPEDLFLCIGTMAVAMVAGLFFFVLPSGAGVREIVIVTSLTVLLGTGPAIALAAVSRVFLTLADLVTAGLASALAVMDKRRARALTLAEKGCG